MRESIIQQKITQKARQQGILCVKVDSSSSRGWPDLTCVLPNGTVLFIELKTPTGKLSRLQEHMIDKLKRNKANVHIIRSVEEFDHLVTSHHN
jgi:DNA anti-recombination protein RmuC|tara:strand:+ start:2937 stop:3215 length:279 start_codon:yes stop_codon:yes gene_type:complete